MSSDYNDSPQSLSRRAALRVFGLSAAGAALAACGGTTTAPTDTGATVPDATASAGNSGQAEATAVADVGGAATAIPTPTVGIQQVGSGSKEVIFWHGLGGADGKTMQVMLEDYGKQNPDVALRAETYDWNVFYQKLPTSVIGNTPPDLAIAHQWAIPQLSAQGVVQPVDDIFFSTGLVPKDDFAQAVIDAITVDGQTLGVPFDNHGWGLWLNTKLLKDAGLDPAALPKNGDEFIQWAMKLTTDENGKHPDEDGFNADKVKVWATHSTWQRFTIPSTMWQFGGGIISDDATKSMLDSEKTIAAVQYWYDLMYEHRVCPPAVPGATGGGDLYKTNSLAFWWDGSWNLNFMKDNPDVAQVTTPMSLNSLAPDGTQVAKIASHCLVIPTGIDGDKLDGAKNLAKWLSDNGKTWANSGQVPARLSVQKDADVQAIPSVAAFAQEFTKIGKPDVAHPAANEIQTAWEDAVSGALAKTASVKDALSAGHQNIQAILARG